MSKLLTAGTQRALHTAFEIARAEEEAVVRPGHLLWGLFLGESRAAELLVQHRFDLAALTDFFRLSSKSAAILERADPQGPADASRSEVEVSSAATMESCLRRAQSEGVPFSEEIKAAIVAAQGSAQRSEPNAEVGTEHLLWGLMAVVEPIRELLGDFGLESAGLGQAFQTETVRDSEPLEAGVPIVFREREETDHFDALRIIDAAANRAREGLRVLEDYARFVLDDSHLTGRLKQWRHDFARTMSLLDVTQLLTARETQQDVGTRITTLSEMRRESLTDVVRANLKRVQEAARTLEEYGKVLSANFAAQVAQLRYELYTLEKGLLLTLAARHRLEGRDLYLIASEALCHHGIGPAVREALDGGASIVQLREKLLPDRRLVELGRRVREWTRAGGALFIMNDRPDLAIVTEADGVHVGQDELTVREARRILGPEKIVGVSTHTLEQARQAVLDGADYIGVGPVFPSRTKSFTEFAGLEFVRQVAAEITLPAFAIGGINLDNIADLRNAGATRAAVSHALCAAEHPARIAREMLELLRRAQSVP